MSADELRQAAETLRWLAGQVTRHGEGWFDADADLRNAIRGTFHGNKESAPDDARWIATMRPGVGLALADLLDTLNYDHDQADLDGSTWDHQVMPLARLINGGAS